MRGFNKLSAFTLVLALAFGAALPAAHAVDKAGSKAEASSEKKPKAKKAKPPKMATSAGSQETTAERSARLKRECKGQVNAGACSGFTD